MKKLKPLCFQPVYQNYIWGGRRFVKRFGRVDTPAPCAESWEISDRPEGMSVVMEGELAGTTLHDLVVMYGESLLGRGRKERRFPLLIKMIDAVEPLSVQVHPSEESSERYGGEPKSEMWYLLEGGAVYAGFKELCSRQALKAAIRENRVQDLLQKIDVSLGDAVFIPGGRIHAIGAGCMMLEVQQNSNTTWRVYDWGRGRELHVKEALECLKLDDVANPVHKQILLEENSSMKRFEILSTLFFSIEKLDLKESFSLECDPATYQIFFDLQKAQSILLPADSEPLDLSAGSYIRIFQEG